MKIKRSKVKATTNNITKGVINQIRADGGWAVRVNVTGIKMPNGEWRKSGGDLGISDCVATYMGISVYGEIKNQETKDRRRPAQIKFRNKMVAAGAVHFYIEDFNKWLHDWNLWKASVNSYSGKSGSITFRQVNYIYES